MGKGKRQLTGNDMTRQCVSSFLSRKLKNSHSEWIYSDSTLGACDVYVPNDRIILFCLFVNCRFWNFNQPDSDQNGELCSWKHSYWWLPSECCSSLLCLHKSQLRLFPVMWGLLKSSRGVTAEIHAVVCSEWHKGAVEGKLSRLKNRTTEQRVVYGWQ